MIACVLIGVVTGFLYLSVLLFCAKDIDTVISSASGPVSLLPRSLLGGVESMEGAAKGLCSWRRRRRRCGTHHVTHLSFVKAVH